MRKRNIDTNQVRNWLFIAVVVGLALLSAAQHLELIFGITFVFTNVMLLLLIRLFGLRIGLFAAGTVYAIALLVFNAPLFILIFFLEACWIGLFRRKKKKYPVLATDAVYWVVLGIPLILLACLFTGPFSWTEFSLLMAISTVNGLFNTLIAEIVLDFLPIRRLLRLGDNDHPPIPFSRALMHVSLIIVALPFLLIMMISGLNSYNESMQTALQASRNTTNMISEELKLWSSEDLLGIRLQNLLQLAYLQEIVERHAAGQVFDLTLTNTEQHLLAASSGPSQYDEAVMDLRPVKEVADNFFVEMPRNASSMRLLPTQEWRNASYVYKSEISDNVPLSLTVSFPAAIYKEQIFKHYIYYLLYMLGSIGVAGILAFIMNRWLSRGLLVLAASTTNLPDKLKQKVALEWPSSSIVEIHSLVHNVKDMSHNLHRMFQESERMNMQLRMSEEKLHHLAYYDSLTGLPNRYHFQQVLSAMFTEWSDRKERIAVMFIDLNRFKQINDSLGHAAGDVLLQQVAMRFTMLTDQNCSVYRLGGDEFVFMQLYEQDEEPREFAERICDCFDQAFKLEGSSVYTTTSVGISLFPEHGTSIGDIVKKADIAMYVAKEKGMSGYHFFNQELEESLGEKMELENGMRSAIENEQFYLEYQPKVDPNSGEPVGFEALVRWKHPDKGLISPSKFIPMAESSGMIIDIDMWVFREACRQTKAWQDEGVTTLPVSINLSARHFGQVPLVDNIRGILRETGLEGRFINIEITESVFIRKVEAVIEMLKQIRSMGIGISIDDFGTGYSSLNQLQRLPITVVKLDRTFIEDAELDPAKSSVVSAVIKLAHSMGLKVVAEGIETVRERSFFAELNCDELQGYYFSKPLSNEGFVQYLKVVPQAI